MLNLAMTDGRKTVLHCYAVTLTPDAFSSLGNADRWTDGYAVGDIAHVLKRRSYRIEVTKDGNREIHWIPEHMVAAVRYEE